MAWNAKLRSFLTLHGFQKVEFHLNKIGNDENETEVNRGSYDWVSCWLVCHLENKYLLIIMLYVWVTNCITDYGWYVYWWCIWGGGGSVGGGGGWWWVTKRNYSNISVSREGNQQRKEIPHEVSFETKMMTALSSIENEYTLYSRK